MRFTHQGAIHKEHPGMLDPQTWRPIPFQWPTSSEPVPALLHGQSPLRRLPPTHTGEALQGLAQR